MTSKVFYGRPRPLPKPHPLFFLGLRLPVRPSIIVPVPVEFVLHNQHCETNTSEYRTETAFNDKQFKLICYVLANKPVIARQYAVVFDKCACVYVWINLNPGRMSELNRSRSRPADLAAGRQVTRYVSSRLIQMKPGMLHLEWGRHKGTVGSHGYFSSRIHHDVCSARSCTRKGYLDIST